MSSGPKNVTSTTSNEPPEFLVGPLTNATNAAQQQFFNQSGYSPTVNVPGLPYSWNGNEQFPGGGSPNLPGFPGGGFNPAGGGGGGNGFGGLGNPTFPFPGSPDLPTTPSFQTGEAQAPPPTASLQAPPTTASLSVPSYAGNSAVPQSQSGGQSSGSMANSLMGGAQNLVGSTIQGDFLSPDSNPYLRDTFNRAADLTQTRLSSEFAGAGRNLGAALPARSDELQTLASNIYGGNYQAERGRQQGAADQAQALDPLNLFINRLAGIIPGAGGSSQSTQPVFRQGLF